MELSLADELARLPDEDRDSVLAGLDPDRLAYDWSFWGRPGQQAPVPNDWRTWLLSAGRGYGKTASETEWARSVVSSPLDSPLRSSPGPTRGALVARTAADVRDVLIQGDSGLLSRFPPSERPKWEPSKRLVTFADGSIALAFSSEEPDQLRGPQFHWALCDELSAWRWLVDDSGLTAWDNVRIATRLGHNPQLVVGTTPKRVPAVRQLLADAALPGNPERIRVTSGATSDNAGNLSAVYLQAVYGMFKGTHLARQELEGILLDDVEGALWVQALLDATRADLLQIVPGTPLQVVVGVDPSVAEQPTDECGIVVAASTSHRDLYRRHMYTLADRSLRASPSVWARAVADAALTPLPYPLPPPPYPIVAEINQGGALVRDALISIDPSLKILPVRARYGKYTRAEPVALAYEQGRVHHTEVFADLEAQLTSWLPSDRRSPDRLDALVWAATALLVRPPDGLHYGPLTAHAPSGLSISYTPAPDPSPSSGRRARALSAYSALPRTPRTLTTSTGLRVPNPLLPPTRSPR